MNICPQCQYPLADRDVCPRCGARLVNPEQQRPEPPAQPGPLKAERLEGPAAPTAAPQQQMPQPMPYPFAVPYPQAHYAPPPPQPVKPLPPKPRYYALKLLLGALLSVVLFGAAGLLAWYLD